MDKDNKTINKNNNKQIEKKDENTKSENKNLILINSEKLKNPVRDKTSNRNVVEKMILVKSLTKNHIVLPYSYVNKQGKIIDKSYKLNYENEIELPKSLVDKIISGSYKNICEIEIIK